MGVMREYASHCVNLWNGTIVSQAWAGGEAGMLRQDQASPSGVPAREVREEGQMEPRPSMRTVQRVGRGMMGTEEARVEGWERR
jgi:hypothetical protein